MYGQQKTPEQQRQLYASFYHDAASVNMDTMPGLTHSVDTDDMDMNSKPPEDHVRNIQVYGRVLKRDGDLRQQQQDHRMAEQQQQLEYNQKNLHQTQSHQPSSSYYQRQYQQQQQQQFYYHQQQIQQSHSRQQRQQQRQPEQQRQQDQQRQRQQQQQYHQPSQKSSAYSYNSPTEDSSVMPSLTFSEVHSSSSSMLSASGPGAIPGNLALPPQNQPEHGVDDNEFFLTSILDMISNTPPATGPGSMSTIPHFDYKSSFTERKMIAKGGNGEVRRAFWPTRHCYVILKSLIETKLSAAKLAVLFDKEVEVMNRCGNHDNLAQFYGIATKPTDPGFPASSLDPDRFIVMQYYEHGDLVHLLKPDVLAEPLTLTDKLYLAMDIAVGLDHLYKCGFHHGDLHPKNILIDSRLNAMYSSSSSFGTSGGRYLARLTDFGLRRIRDNTHDVSSQQFGGVWQFMAPERMVKKRPRPRYNVRCDIFALGAIYWQIMSGVYPFQDPSTYSPGAKEPRPEGVPDWYYAVYTRAWSENPLERQQDLEEIASFGDRVHVAHRTEFLGGRDGDGVPDGELWV
ncbi:hypothetical protein BGZ81_008129 [Podila clonocystis]|nr:hypothetical protein BGZ81_008129 [Podila clonocystis]